MKAKIYNQEGKESGNIELPNEVFDAAWNADLVHQVVISMQANARTPIAHTHDRGEQRGGGRKPWKQKGTGRARHGSRRSPIWRSGGVTHGPRNEKNYNKKINTKMRTRALFSVLSHKLKDNEVLFVDSLAMNDVKTRDAKKILLSLSTIPGFEELANKKKNAALLTLSKKNDITKKSFRNMGNVSINEVLNLNTLDVLSYKYLIISDPSESLTILQKKRGVRSVANKQEKKTVKEVAKSKVKKENSTLSQKKSTKKSSTKIAKKKVSARKVINKSSA